MYVGEIFAQWRLSVQQAKTQSSRSAKLSPTVYALGATSLLTDVATEMVASILPVYLLLTLRLSTTEYGLLDGLFRGGAAIIAVLLGGWISYSGGREKWVAGIGYALSSLTKVILLFTGSFAGIAVSLILDRFGKGLRVAPRDALLSAAVPVNQLGIAFGVHRAMDGIGAVLGPLIAALILWQTPTAFRPLFCVAVFASILGMFVFARYVRPSPAGGALARAAGEERQSYGIVLRNSLPLACRRLLCLAMLLTLFTLSEGMMYAFMQRSFDLPPYLQALLPVATAFTFMLFAAPMGWLADRFGAIRVFGTAHALLLPLYGMLTWAGNGHDTLLVAAALVFMLGCFLAATDGVLMAAVATAVPAGVRTVSLALFAAGLALMKLVSSALFGLLWDRYDIPIALAIYGVGLTIGLLFFFSMNPLRGLLKNQLAVDPI